MQNEDIISLYHAKRLWIFVLISGALHIYIGILFITTDVLHYFWLSKVFIIALIANGVSEILFHFITFRKIEVKRLLAAFYDIAFGVFIFFVPILTIFILPLYIALALIIRSITDLRTPPSNKLSQLFKTMFLKTYSWIRILLAALIILSVIINKNDVLLSGMAIVLTGVVNILLSIKLKLIDLPIGHTALRRLYKE